MPPDLAPGDELAGYRIEYAAGAGGMGTVFRARRRGRESVALKLVELPGEGARERFRAEADALHAVRHPGVVGLSEHGTLDDIGWLALEWLDGVDLARHLREHGSSPRDALDWGRQLAEALEAVHGAGLVHRDLKPSNVLRRPDGRLALIDFGIVGALGAEQRMGPAGTPGYMAPEQARGAALDARSDLFALGCVLFEAATGRPAFAGQHRVATLARVVLDDVPRARELRTDVPPALDEAIARLLRKRADDRPSSAREVRELLQAQALPEQGVARIREDASLEHGELQLVSVIVVASAEDDATLTQAAWDPRVVEGIADRASARLEVLADGTQLLCLAGSGEAGDCVRRAAECALELYRQAPELAISLATGRADVSRRWPVGEAVDVAVAQLAGQQPGAPLVDELSAGLLRGSAVLSPDKRRLTALAGPSDAAPPVFGRTALLAQCELQLEERSQLLVRGPAGIGKSHLGRALRERLKARGWRSCAARSSELSRAVPYAALRLLLLEALEVAPSGVTSRLEEKFLKETTAEDVGLAHAAVLAFAIGAPCAHPLLRAVQRDPARLEEALTSAWRAWLELESRAQRLALFVDDAQWCDAASFRLLYRATPAAVRVVWLARPGAALEAELPALDVPPLDARAAAQLVSALIEAPAAELQQLVDQAEGNPLFLEELSRARVDGEPKLGATTVLAMLQARFGALPERDRLILRAASVFGRDFERQALPQLLGTRLSGAELDARLSALVERGVLARSEQLGKAGLEFRHDLWRDAAYGSFTDANRTRVHRLAAQFLEEQSQSPPSVLAQHFQLAGASERASHWWVRAAEAATLASDHLGARAQLGNAGQLVGEDRARGARVEAELELWAGHMSAARDAARLACSGLPPGDSQRRALALAVQASGRLGDLEVLYDLRSECRGDPWLTCQLARELVRLGDSSAAAALLEQMPTDAANDVEVAAELASLNAARALSAGDLAEQLRQWQRALAAYEALGLQSAACATRGEIGFCHSLLGDFVAADEHIAAAFAEAERDGYRHVRAWLLCIWGPVLGELGQLERAVAIEHAALAAFAEADDPRLSGACWAYLSLLHVRSGALAEAQLAAARAEQSLEAYPPLFGLALAALGRAVCAARDRQAMAEVATRAARLLESDTEFEEGRSLLQLVFCELCDALGHEERARAVAESAAGELEQRAQAIGDITSRNRFLTRVGEHRALLERAGRLTPSPHRGASSGDTTRSDC